MAAYFAIFLVVITSGSGLIWLVDAMVYAPKRKLKVQDAQAAAGGVIFDEETVHKVAPQSAIAETAQSVFPILFVITFFRSFLYEPFQIPSGSMMPTLLVGDFILVEKYAYGVKDPIWRNKLIENGKPERGDAAVFKYPEDTRVDYIKRIVGLPGDIVRYRNRQLSIKPSCTNSPEKCDKFHKLDMKVVNQDEFSMTLPMRTQNGVEMIDMPLMRLKEDLLGVEHDILVNPNIADQSARFYKQGGRRTGEWLIPEGKYLAFGDNRDNSTDSRYWGFVDDELLVGKAVFIWMSFEFDQSGEGWLPGWVPVGVRFDRLGPIL